MIRATKIEPAGRHQTSPSDRVLLDFDARYRRRTAMRTAGGLEFLLDLEHAQRLRHGDHLLLEDGRRIKVEAAPEDLVEIRSAATGTRSRSDRIWLLITMSMAPSPMKAVTALTIIPTTGSDTTTDSKKIPIKRLIKAMR